VLGAGLWWRSRRPARALLLIGAAVAAVALACMSPLVANALGYDDAHYFSRLFRKVTGVSPQQYRRLERG